MIATTGRKYTMNSITKALGNHAIQHKASNVEFSGVCNSLVYYENRPVWWFHFFIRYGDKVYIEVRDVGEIIISFAELQKNKYLKYYYDLSLMLTNEKYKNKVIQYHKYGSEYHNKQIYNEPRLWSFNTAYIETNMNTNKTTLKDIGDICYYKINPYELMNMEYASQEELEIFNKNYIATLPEITNNVFDKRGILYNNVAIEYQACLMEKELDELSTIFEDKKNVLNLVALNGKEGMNCDLLRVIYDFLVNGEVSGELNKNKYKGIIDTIEECKNKLELNAQILES
jgi:hypothetical protein